MKVKVGVGVEESVLKLKMPCWLLDSAASATIYYHCKQTKEQNDDRAVVLQTA